MPEFSIDPMPSPFPRRPAGAGFSQERWERVLPRVEKPGRYVGGEWNEIRKPPGEVRVRIGLAFPDVYEIGMSYLGQKILYAVLNARPGIAAERVFAPWPDLEEALRREGLPLVSLETKTPLARFDILGFSLLYELNSSNILTMLDLGGVPLLSRDRTGTDPLVMAGGPAAFNPEPLAEVFDAFLIGDGEEAFPEIARVYEEGRRLGRGRARVLETLARVPGVYVPSLYAAVRPPGSRLVVPEPGPGVPPRVIKRTLLRLPAEYPARIVVPHVQAVFDRVAMEVARGCPQKCRFCQASSIYFPHRPRDREAVIDSILRSLEATGYEDASLSALSVGDYPGLGETVRRLMDEFAGEGLSLSLSSLRPGRLSAEVMDSIIQVRKTGFTLVPEAGTERLRRVINKNLEDRDILAAAENAFRRGWRLLKLYFMIGLPTEEQRDMEGIVDVIQAVLDAGRRVRGTPPQIHVSVSSFIPKPHTPFQWLGMEDERGLAEKMNFLLGRLKKHRSVQLKFHDLKTSVLEAVFSRGDRRLTGALVEAWRQGARFDSWKDRFCFETWERALVGRGLEYRDYLSGLDPEAPLPWDIVDGGLTKEYLRREYERALAGEATPSCVDTDCASCRGCRPELRSVKPAREEAPAAPVRPLGPPPLGHQTAEVRRYRARFAKDGPARFLSHNDLTNALRRAFRRAGVKVLRSRGFHPKMLVSYLPALPLGMAGRSECLEFKSDREFGEPEFLARVNGCLPAGLRFLTLECLAPGEPSLGLSLVKAVYSLEVDDPEVRTALRAAGRSWALDGLDEDALWARLIEEVYPRPERERLGISLDTGAGRLRLEIAWGGGVGPRPQDIVKALLPDLEHPVHHLVREEAVLARAAQIDIPA
jgi:radical SAM family uncharacterized protein/radical SAM-linked protein